MIILPFLTLLLIAAFFAGKIIKKHSVKLYAAATIIAVLAFILKDKQFMAPIVQGYLGFTLFYIVMITGSFKKSTKLRRKLILIRKDYSILGFIFISPHALIFTLQALKGVIAFEWFGIVAFILMIPLFVTSFTIYRKKMSAKNWMRLQLISYIIYILLCIHLIISYTSQINLVIYIVLFGFYFVNKTIYEISRLKAKKLLQTS